MKGKFATTLERISIYLPFVVSDERMSDRNKNITTAVVALAGVGVFYMLAKYRADIWRHIRALSNSRNRLRNQQVKIVNNAEECRNVMKNIKL